MSKTSTIGLFVGILLIEVILFIIAQALVAPYEILAAMIILNGIGVTVIAIGYSSSFLEWYVLSEMLGVLLELLSALSKD